MLSTRLGLLLFALAAGGCAKPTSEPAGSCYRDRDSACIDYDTTRAAAGKRLCTGFHWTNGERSCPAAGRLGTCTREGTVEIFYGGPPNQYDADAAKKVCVGNGGTFAPTR